eukprot:CAMPEP_0202691732 /NCGR_PEP_ID=MMETSP1385-20130828/6367_1 /ASSEMBLY_ACC=CAM_ASM_000861 /TAXON_ID=933848 /ORGANISM="Elphidium margaritaceum" /LENGTH=408 /DNA_ID=CAMNT_0049347177 /DNA_START=36 /DNA_END=1262 /DNA_ORIENTATION=+
MTDSILDFEKQNTPYYTPAHREYRLHVRKFREQYVDPYIDKWIHLGDHPRGIQGVRDYVKQMVDFGGIYLFPWSYDTWTDSKGVKQKWDPFYLIIYSQEMGVHAFGFGVEIVSMSLGPLIRFASNDVHRKALDEIKAGKKFIALAVSELSGGSDVAQIKSTATKTDDGKFYIVNGNKYWITGGERADYFVTLVRTSQTGRFGVSLLLIPRCNGVFTSKLKLQGNEGNATAAVTFANVKVPVENLIYKENMGFVPLMTNFNRERFIICSNLVSDSRLCVTEAIRWAKERKTFGKTLIKHQVIKHKIANMARETLACQSFLERVAYQMQYDPYGSKDRSVVRNVSLLKVQASKCLQMCTIEASQIFGGRSYVRGGRGGVVERLYRQVRASAIAGGSEEIMLDLAMRQAKL